MNHHMKTSYLVAFAFLIACAGCKTAPKTDYTAFVEHMPKSILVLPPINESANVHASNAFLSTITMPLAERGYYIFPIAVVDQMMKENGVPTPPDMHQVSLEKLDEVFGADAVLYISINEWVTQYVVLDSSNRVTLSYRLVDVDSGALLWKWQQTFVHSSSAGQSSLIGMAVAAAVHAAVSTSGEQERNVAIQANLAAFFNPNHGLLSGHRHPNFEKDQARVLAKDSE